MVTGNNAFGVLEDRSAEDQATREEVDALLGSGLDDAPEPAAVEPATTPAVQPEATPAPQRVETAPPGDPDPAADEQASGDGSQPASKDDLIWGRYKSLTDAHEGFKNMQRREERTAAEKAQLEQEIQKRDQILQQMLVRMQQGQTPLPDPNQPAELDPLKIIQDRAREAARQELEQQMAQQQGEQLYGKVMETVNQFREKYPDAAEGSEVDNIMGDIVNEFQTDAEGNLDPSLFPMDNVENLELVYVCAKNPQLYRTMLDLDLVPSEENLTIAYEATQNPNFGMVLRATGVLQQDDPDGSLLEWARQMAGIPGQVQAVQVQAARGPSPEAMRAAATVTTGGNGAPVNGAPGPKPLGPIDEAIQAYRATASDNAFGV